MTTTPPPPSSNPQWQDPKIQEWRQDAARLRDRFVAAGDECLDHNDSWTTDYFRHYGIKQVTEELVLLMWVTLPFLMSFVQARLRQDYPHGQYVMLTALSRGLDFAGIELLRLEQRIGEYL